MNWTDIARTALLIVDVQMAFAHRDAAGADAVLDAVEAVGRRHTA